MKDVISVLLADDHQMFREMLATRLNREPDIQAVRMASNAEDAIAEALRLNPDVVLMDVDMPGLICFDAAQTIQARCPEARIVFLSAFLNDQYIERAIAVKAMGYVVKNEPSEAVIKAVRSAAAGKGYFSRSVQSRIVVDSDGARLPRSKRSRVSTLTSREVEVLRYIARGMARREIAQLMHISVNTVRCHIANVMEKLDIHDRVELARLAVREGLAEL
jgi:DNA-binding NarL/FixJ family response regulator